MRFNPAYCPYCGLVAYGTQEMIPGIAQLDLQEDGTFEYNGSTDVCWDAQHTPTDERGCVMLTCNNDHQWSALLFDDGEEEGAVQARELRQHFVPQEEEEPPVRRIRRAEDRVSGNSIQGGNDEAHLPREGL